MRADLLFKLEGHINLRSRMLLTNEIKCCFLLWRDKGRRGTCLVGRRRAYPSHFAQILGLLHAVCIHSHSFFIYNYVSIYQHKSWYYSYLVVRFIFLTMNNTHVLMNVSFKIDMDICGMSKPGLQAVSWIIFHVIVPLLCITNAVMNLANL